MGRHFVALHVEAQSFPDDEDKASDASGNVQHHFKLPFLRTQGEHWHEVHSGGRLKVREGC
eukprot:1832648-Karenia_brevis.AAC.1